MKIEIKGSQITIYGDMAAMREQGIPFCLLPSTGINGWISSKHQISFMKRWLMKYSHDFVTGHRILIRERDFSLVKMIASCDITAMA